MAYNYIPQYASATGGAAQVQTTVPAGGASTGLYSYVDGFDVTGLGATSATTVDVTLTDGTVTLHYRVAVPAGVTTGITPLSIRFSKSLQSTAVNTAWTLTVPTFGSGNTNVSASIYGYQAT